MQLKIRLLASVCLYHSKGLLLLRRKRDFKEIAFGKGLWELPGGKVEFGEWPSTACRRETAEETGWHIRQPFEYQKMLAYRLDAGDVVSHRFNLMYRVSLPDGSPDTLKLGDEHDDCCFIRSLQELRALAMVPAIKLYLLGLTRRS